MNTATREAMILDLRRRRADMFTGAVMQEIRAVLHYDVEREVHEKLFKLFYENGASIMTDEDRAKEGFEPRDAKGWTPSERVRENELMIEAMTRMIKPIFVEKPE